MTRERRSFLFAFLLGAATFGLVAARQGPITNLRGQFLNNCDVDIRPALSGEAQLYWGEPAPGVHGMHAAVWVTMPEAIEVGNWDATKTLKMTVGKANTVDWAVDTSVMPYKTKLKISNNLDPALDIDVTPGGTYDPLGPMLEPIVEDMRTRPPSGPGMHERRRIRVTLRNYGLSVPITVGDV